ncbi:MAG: lysophospholipid acyltransferase family protein [Candidatus Tectimicrobiota bacterium]
MVGPLTFWQKLWLFIAIVVVNLYARLIARVEIEGRGNVPHGGGVLLAANHCSALDVLLIPMAVMTRWPLTPFEYIKSPAKERFIQIPIVGAIIRSWGAFPIRPIGRDVAAMGRIVELMKTDRVMIFPEGTRSPDGQLQPGMRSAGWLIHQARPLVIPVALFGTEKVWPRRCRLPRPYGRVKVVFGKPLNLDQYYNQPHSRAVAQQVVDEIMAAIAHLKGVHQPAWDTSPPVRRAL